MKRLPRLVAVAVALVLLIPLAGWITMRGPYQDYRRNRALDPITVASGKVAHWHHASWLLIKYEVNPKPDGFDPAAGPMGPGEVVRVTVGVKATSAAAQQGLGGCVLRLRDDRGRTWTAGDVPDARYRSYSSSCAGTPASGPPKAYPVTGLFRVPPGVGRRAALMVTFVTAYPHYLLLRR